jgi:hypothetical protein
LLDLIFEVKYLEAWLGGRTSQQIFRKVQTREFIPWGELSMFIWRVALLQVANLGIVGTLREPNKVCPE